MKKVFKTIDGKIQSVVSYTLNMLQKDPTIEIHIGTDSQNYKTTTTYVTVIAYHFGGKLNGGGKGVHYLYYKEKVPKIKDRYTRLYKEAELSIELANYITSQINVRLEIDLDYNENAEHFSNKLVSATKGWANSEGYKVNIKPNSQIATKAADHLCK